jgi:hypothetical protein
MVERTNCYRTSRRATLGDARQFFQLSSLRRAACCCLLAPALQRAYSKSREICACPLAYPPAFRLILARQRRMG